MVDRPTIRYTLSDGSVCEVEPIGFTSSLIRRIVDGRTVWAQGFAMDTATEHSDQIGVTVAQMKAHPSSFRRWYITSPQDPA